mgnify:CR=1 FL=1
MDVLNNVENTIVENGLRFWSRLPDAKRARIHALLADMSRFDTHDIQ